MTNSQMLENKIKESGYLKQWILDQMGIKSYETLRAKIRNKRDFTASEIDKLCEILHINYSHRRAIFFA